MCSLQPVFHLFTLFKDRQQQQDELRASLICPDIGPLQITVYSGDYCLGENTHPNPSHTGHTFVKNSCSPGLTSSVISISPNLEPVIDVVDQQPTPCARLLTSAGYPRFYL